MKIRLLIALVLSLLLPGQPGFAGDTETLSNDLKAVIGKIQAKLNAGKATEKDLAPELKDFDTLLARHKGGKPDEVVQILELKTTLYLQVLHNYPKAKETVAQIKRDFPGTRMATASTEIVAMIDAQAESQKAHDDLAPGSKFPDFNEKDISGKPLSIASYKGKVVLVEFWATWCMPCIMELPNILNTYQKYHDKGFEVIGISLDEEQDKLTAFIKQRGMPWPQYFDGQGWKSKLVVKYAVTSIPTTYLLDRKGKIIATGLRGEELDKAVANALKTK
jgi:thiol-disulfide isomerase/thioredoxin